MISNLQLKTHASDVIAWAVIFGWIIMFLSFPLMIDLAITHPTLVIVHGLMIVATSPFVILHSLANCNEKANAGGEP